MGDHSSLLSSPCRLLLVFLIGGSCGLVNCQQKPHILILLADDAGWNDFQSHDPSMVTPNIDQLRKEGLFLNQSYTYPSCVPSRTALLSGRYAHVLGTQDDVISGEKISWLDENLTLLPGELKKVGYKTHMLGKWHLGFCHPGLTPPLRGFDTFYGYWGGAHESYYTHVKAGGFDWKDGNVTDWSASGVYQTDLLNTRAESIIRNSDASQPLFMYLSWGAVHGPFDEPPSHYMQQYCSHITDPVRRVHCTMMAVLDKGLGSVLTALKDKGMYDNSVILFMTDNGGPVGEGGANNWPLRGGKKGLYEGGIRVYTIFKAPGLAAVNTVWPGLAHSVDWLPTLVKIAGGVVPANAHGKSLWTNLKRNELPSPRDFLIYADDYPKFNYSAIRYQDWKLIGPVPGLAVNSYYKPSFDAGWYPPYQMILNGSAAVEDNVKEKFKPNEYLLFNIRNDPSERTNLAKDRAYANVLADLKNRLQAKLVEFPLTHTRTEDELAEGNNEINNELVTCWCKPPGLAHLDYLCPNQA